MSRTPGGTTSRYSYDRANRITAAAGVSYTVDANGRLTARGTNAFTYDHANRLTSATIAGASSN